MKTNAHTTLFYNMKHIHTTGTLIQNQNSPTTNTYDVGLNLLNKAVQL